MENINFTAGIKTIYDKVTEEAKSRAVRASVELKNAELKILGGQRSGRWYKVPGTYRKQKHKSTGEIKSGVYYQASAPYESPAVRLGALRLGWTIRPQATALSNNLFVVTPQIFSIVRLPNGRLLADLLENGSEDGKIAPRPFEGKIKQLAFAKITAIYKEKYSL